MKKIQLVTEGGYEAIVDDEDYEGLAGFRWHLQRGPHTNYATRCLRVKDVKEWSMPNRTGTVWMHRQIMGLWSGGHNHQVDHLNGNGLDNRRENLMVVTPQENQWNQPRAKGYFWNTRVGKFQAMITAPDGRQMSLGFFDDKESARKAYLDAKFAFHLTAPMPSNYVPENRNS